MSDHCQPECDTEVEATPIRRLLVDDPLPLDGMPSAWAMPTLAIAATATAAEPAANLLSWRITFISTPWGLFW